MTSARSSFSKGDANDCQTREGFWWDERKTLPTQFITDVFVDDLKLARSLANINLTFHKTEVFFLETLETFNICWAIGWSNSH